MNNSLKTLSLISILSILLGNSPLLNANGLLVKTYPDGARDDETAYLFKNSTSLVSFIVYAKEKPFELKKGELTLTIPSGLKIVNFGVYRDKYPEDMINCNLLNSEENIWTLSLGDRIVETVYQIYGKYPLVPWSTFVIYAYLRPSGKALPATKFDMAWRLSGNGIKPFEGKMKISLVSAPEGEKMPKDFFAWSAYGNDGNVADRESFDDFLKLAKNCGINGIINSGPGLPSYYSLSELNKKGFSVIKYNLLKHCLIRPPDILAEAGFPIKDNDRAISFTGHNPSSRKDNLGGEGGIYCPSKFLLPDSPVMEYMVQEYLRFYNEGCHIFFSDYEDRSYARCYCQLCRKKFSEEAGLDYTFIMKLKPEELIEKYTRQWHLFRTRQNASMLKTLRDKLKPVCKDIFLGINEARCDYKDISIPGSGRGFSYFPEDPVILDASVDFHDADILASGVGSMQQLELWFTKNQRGQFYINKPVIARVSSFVSVNWGYWCVLGRMEKGKFSREYSGMGCDWRPLNQKLEIANAAAIGAKGIEVDFTPSSTDALVINAIHSGMDYIGEFEEMLDKKYRQNWETIKVYDLTSEKSPRKEIMEKGFMSRRFLANINKYGTLQYTYHRKDDKHLISIFNWDYYQTKQVKILLPEFSGKDNFYIHLYNDGQRHLLIQENGKKEWNAVELADGLFLEIYRGSLTAILFAEKIFPGYKEMKSEKKLNITPLDTPLKLYSWRGEENYSGELFKEVVYKTMLENMKKHILEKRNNE
ncbi:MAG: hypothetical protein A2017_05295 [Lentisphaerae bacterium GWF2_44_16]|nr:MAG: hypothetical protein A2017_05295 [Lentisphaerae bacterium GWF2_44_16]